MSSKRANTERADHKGTRNIFHVIVLSSNATPTALPSWLFSQYCGYSTIKGAGSSYKDWQLPEWL
jgi:hypothetical protein